jgi:CDP-glucose 4,6-dehydratase
VDGLEKMSLSFYKNKKVFVTGHTGFKGSWLCRALIIASADVTGYALRPETNPALFELLSLKKHKRLRRAFKKP